MYKLYYCKVSLKSIQSFLHEIGTNVHTFIYIKVCVYNISKDQYLFNKSHKVCKLKICSFTKILNYILYLNDWVD